jgi:hypothetical protein
MIVSYTPCALISPGDLILYPGPWAAPYLVTSVDERWFGGYTLRGTYFDMKASHFRPQESIMSVQADRDGVVVCDAEYRKAFGLDGGA